MTISARPILCAAVAGVLGLTGFASAQQAQPTPAELQAQITQLQAQLNAMQSQAAVKQEAKTAEQVRTDAAAKSAPITGSQLLAGHKDHFFIASEDGAFTLEPTFQFQFRSVTNLADFNGGGSDGFEIRRMKFGFQGTAFTPKLEYDFRLAVNRQNGNAELDNAFIQYEFAPSWSFTAGQWKDIPFHEETVSSSRQLGVDRSLVNEELGGGVTDYVQGVAASYAPKDAPYRATVGYHDGLNTDNTRFFDREGGAGGVSPNYGVSGRAEYALSGNFKEYKDFSRLGKQSEDSLVFGAGADYSAGGRDDILLHSVDVSWKPAALPQLAVYGAYYGIYREVGAGSAYDFGGEGEVAYLLSEKWEVFGRYDFVRLDNNQLAAGEQDLYHEIGVGLNYYLSKHAAKVTIDATYLPNGSPGGSGIGFITSDQDEFLIRGQFQLLL